MTCLACEAGASRIGPQPPLEELVAESERILVVEVSGEEQFDDGEYTFTRTHLRVVWDITRAAGQEATPDDVGSELSVVVCAGVVGGRIAGGRGGPDCSGLPAADTAPDGSCAVRVPDRGVERRARPVWLERVESTLLPMGWTAGC